MRTPLPSSALAVLVFLGAVPAQLNLIQNGDFETGQLAPWVEAGYRRAAQVSKFDVAGSGSTYNYNCLHGGNSTQTKKPNGYFPGNSIEQNVLLVQAREYLFTADLLVQNVQFPTANADAGLVEVYSDNQVVASFDFGSHDGSSPKRERMCFVYKAPSSGTRQVRIEFSRRFVSSAFTPTIFIDNVSLVQAPTYPLVCPRGERKVGTTVRIELVGTASARFLLFLSLGRLPTGAGIPGFNGAWWLANPALPVVGGQLDSNGSFTLPAPVPSTPGLAGLLLHWQGIEAAPAVSMGVPASFAFY